jgi:phage shock protein C
MHPPALNHGRSKIDIDDTTITMQNSITFSTPAGRVRLLRSDIPSRFFLLKNFQEGTKKVCRSESLRIKENSIDRDGSGNYAPRGVRVRRHFARSQMEGEMPEQYWLRQLSKAKDDRWIGGVCGGLGKHTPLPSWTWRVMFSLLFFCFGTGLLIYFLLWVFMPKEP